MNKRTKERDNVPKGAAPRAKLPASPGSKARKSRISSKLEAKAESDRNAAKAQAEEWLKDPEMNVQAFGWHQVSQALGGIFIYRTVEMTTPEIDPEEVIQPFFIASADELCREFGDKDGLEMAQACAELPFHSQRKLSISLLRKNKANRPSSVVVAALKRDGIKIEEFLKN